MNQNWNILLNLEWISSIMLNIFEKQETIKIKTSLAKTKQNQKENL